jgi:signal transduction histidine kinase/CheY-like chemotaxis protein
MSGWPWLQASLYRKYLVYFALVVTAALLASSVTGLYYSYQETRAAAIELQREKARGASAQIDQYIQAIEQQIRWTILPHQSDDHRKDRYLDLLKLLRQVAAITEVSWLDENGRERVKVSRRNMDRVETGIDRSGEAGFIQASARKTHYGSVYFRKDTEPYVSIAISEEPPYTGVVVAEVNLTFVSELVSQTRLGATGHAYVVDGAGKLISHPNLSLVLRDTDFSSLPQVRQALAGATGPGVTSDARNLEGAPVLATHARIQALGWIVFVEQVQREAFAPLYASMLRDALLMLLGVVLAAAASTLLARRMVRPIRALQKGAARIGAGALDQRFEIRSGDELETLAEEFDRMAARLRESYAGLEQKVAERTEELVAANRAKTRFLAAASHDLRQPLHTLALYAAALKLHAPEGATGEIAGHIDKALAELSVLVNSLLDISKLDAGAVQPEPQRVSVRALIEHVAADYRLVASERALEFKVRAADVHVITDPVLLERLVRNLVDNAFKYTASGGVTLLAGSAGSADSDERGVVRIAVHDTGAGIPAGERERIFEEFYQIGNAERDRSQGLGLGLAIVRRIARLLGLEVELESEPGRGSTFAVTLPCAPEQLAAPPAAAAPVAQQSRTLEGAQVLVIDDEPEVRTGMQTLLEHLGCRVAVCGSYAEAERLLDERALEVDLIVADFRLRQHENGIETVRRLRARLGEVPALLVSGDTAPERLREAQASGLPLLHKPVSLDKLMQTMLAVLRR